MPEKLSLSFGCPNVLIIELINFSRSLTISLFPLRLVSNLHSLATTPSNDITPMLSRSSGSAIATGIFIIPVIGDDCPASSQSRSYMCSSGGVVGGWWGSIRYAGNSTTPLSSLSSEVEKLGRRRTTNCQDGIMANKWPGDTDATHP